MITVDDIFHHIALDLCNDSVADEAATPVDEFATGCRFDAHLFYNHECCRHRIHHLERYGKVRIFYFRVHDDNHGKALASQIFAIMHGSSTDMYRHTGSNFDPTPRSTYLFIHMKGLALMLLESAN